MKQGIVLVVLIAFIGWPIEAQNSVIAGTITSATGQPVSGALVKANNKSLGLGFMVVSQGKGLYRTPNLPPGKYTVQAFGGSSQSAPQDAELSSGNPTKISLALNVPLQIPPREKRLSNEEWEWLIPEADDPFIRNTAAPVCSECHTLEWIVSARKTPEEWRKTMERMTDKVQSYAIGRRPLPFVTQETLQFAEYLSKYFTPDNPQDPRVAKQWLLHPGGPSHANRNLPSSLLKGPASSYVAFEFSVPLGSAPQDIAVDSHEIVWVTESNTGMLGRFDPNSLKYTRIAVPRIKDAEAHLRSVAVDPQDQIWFVDDSPQGRIIRYNPQTLEFKSYPIPAYKWATPADWARIGALRFLDGNVWAAGMATDRILKLDPSTGDFSHYSVPRGSVPFGLATGKEGSIYYSGEVGNSVVKLDPKGLGEEGKLTPYQVAIPRSDLKALAGDVEGNMWVAALNSGKLLRVDRAGKYTEYNPPTDDPGPYAVDVDMKRNLVWFSEIFSDRLARFNPADNSFVEFPLPLSDSDVQRIEVDRVHPNRVWWSSVRNDEIGYIEVIEP